MLEVLLGVKTTLLLVVLEVQPFGDYVIMGIWSLLAFSKFRNPEAFL